MVEGRYRGMVSEVEILTPRGVRLRGTFVNPVDSGNAAVLFSHSVLCDRNSSPHFPRLSKMYRSLGYATLIFDYSGHGYSDDDRISVDHRTEDLRAASGWLADQGFGRQLLHAHSTGGLSAFKAHPFAVDAMFVTSAVLGPVTYEWDRIFAPAQLEQLDSRGFMEVPDDSPGPRETFTLTSQTLVDLSLTKAPDLLRDLEVPTLLVYDRADESAGLVANATEAFHLFPDGSRLEIVQDAEFSDQGNLERLSGLARDWILTQVPREGRP